MTYNNHLIESHNKVKDILSKALSCEDISYGQLGQALETSVGVSEDAISTLRNIQVDKMELIVMLHEVVAIADTPTDYDCVYTKRVVESARKLIKQKDYNMTNKYDNLTLILDYFLDNQNIQLHAGEMSAQELRSVKAIVNCIKRKVKSGIDTSKGN